MTVTLYAGFDSSTQGLTAVLIRVGSASRDVVWQDSINFDRDLPAYGTSHGVLPHPDRRVVHAPPQMWVEALDLMMMRLANAAAAAGSPVAAIAGSAQQHGSVYLNAHGVEAIGSLDPARSLVEQLSGGYSRETSPVWMDSSTTAECDEIEGALGGARKAAALTGSRVYERFTGPQIRRFWRMAPEAYAATERVHLLSSFLASLLAGREAAIEPGDGAGMNLMNLAAGTWAPRAVEATAPALAARLPSTGAASAVIGRLAQYWCERHGFSPATKVIAWTGDNPSSLIGAGLVSEGRVAISLGTSDTIFGAMDAPRVSDDGTGHVFGAPTGGFMGITVFRNGSLARERVRDMFGLGWDEFSAALETSPPGNNGGLVLPWFEPEITPAVSSGGWRHRGVDTANAPAVIRGTIEGQMLAMARHSRWMGVRIDRIHATGGGSANRAILRVIANVFGAAVERFEITNSAALGAAIRAFQAHSGCDWEDAIAGFVEPVPDGMVSPDPAAVKVYERLAADAEAFERAERDR